MRELNTEEAMLVCGGAEMVWPFPTDTLEQLNEILERWEPPSIGYPSQPQP